MDKVKQFIKNFPVIKQIIFLLKKIKLSFLEDMSLYDLIKIYILGIIEGDVPSRATSIAFSFFMALFPFALFILNLIPYIPIKGFQEDFMNFVQENVPPTTFDAISKILFDILHNSHTGLLSTGVFMAIFLMANGINAVLSGFENSRHIVEKRAYFQQYFIALGLSLLLSTIFLITVAAIVITEVLIQKTILQDVLSDRISLLEISRLVFVILMILISTSVLFKFGIKQKKAPFFSIGSVFTTLLFIFTSYVFGIWVVKFSKYNELYGSIGTLLIVMFYIWINCMILLLGFELNVIIARLKRLHHQKTQL